MDEKSTYLESAHEKSRCQESYHTVVGYCTSKGSIFFRITNDLPTMFEVVSGATKKQMKEKSAVSALKFFYRFDLLEPGFIWFVGCIFVDNFKPYIYFFCLNQVCFLLIIRV